MPTVTCVALAAALLQAAAGLGKLWHPSGFMAASAQVARAMPATAVRAIGIGEALVAGWALVAGGALAWALVAASYVAFTTFALLLRRRSGGAGSCGCFGREQTPVSLVHLTVTSLAAIVAGLAAAGDAAGASVTALVPAIVVTALSYSVLVVLPPVRAAGRLVQG